MFRTGGLSQGTGITSGLDTPRIGYVRGGRIATNGRYNFNIAGLVSPSMATEYAMGQGTYTPGGSGSGSWRAALEKARAARKPSKFLEWLKKFKPSQANLARIATTPGVGIGTTAALPVGAAGLTHMVQKSLPEELKGEGGLFDTSTAAWGGMGAGAGLDPEVDEILRGKKVSDSKTSDGTPITTAKGPPGGGDPDMFYKKEEELPIDLLEPGETPKSAEDILREAYEDTPMTKGEKALILADVIGTPGGTKAKTKKAIDLLKDEAKAERIRKAAGKREVAKMIYGQKGKEKIAGMKPKTQVDLVDRYVSLRQKITSGKASDAEKSEFVALKETIGKAQTGQLSEANKLEIALKISNIERKLEQAIKDEEKELIEKYQEQLDIYKKWAGKEGGRVDRAYGNPNPTIPSNQNTKEPTEQVTKFTFEELRNRLPKEITDDVVKLISQSEEAMQDFAFIRTQGDVGKFNTKYGVNLVLPPQA